MRKVPRKRVRRRMPPGAAVLPPAAKKFLQPGGQTALTKEVLDYSKRFQGSGLETAQAIVEDLAKFKRRAYSVQAIGQFYAKRTAGEIIRSGFVAVTKGKNMGELASIEGCIDYNVALCSALRAKWIPAKFVRIKNHTVTHFYLNGRWFEADPTACLARIVALEHIRHGRTIDLSKLPPLIRPVDAARAMEIEAEKWRGNYAEGLDAWDIGIRSIGDFRKYWRTG